MSMKILYLDCGMGASGDMLMGALASLLDAPDAFERQMNALGLEHVSVSMEKSVKCGVVGNHVRVQALGKEEESLDEHHHHEHSDHDHHDHDHHDHEHHHEHHHSGMGDIRGLIASLNASDAVKARALRVYEQIAAAESEVHGVPVDQIHFHEVGALDAVADIVGVCLLMEMLAPDRVIASPVRTGFGHVRCAHGILPVPAPATALLLKGIPCYAGNIEGEMLTPTGAALLKTIADEFGPMPALSIEKIGYGMGAKDFPAANCVRAILASGGDSQARIAELKCNLDDMTAEAIGYATGVLLGAGALDVFTESIQMKKNRPGTLLTCLCAEGDSEKFARLMLEHTTTRGVRRALMDRYVLASRTETVQTRFGPVRVKVSEGYGVKKRKPEYDDAAAIAARENLPIAEILQELNRI